MSGRAASFGALWAGALWAGCVMPVAETGVADLAGGEPSDCIPQAVQIETGGGWFSHGTCSGIAIGADLVLTAAHCVVLGGKAQKPRLVYAGEAVRSVTESFVQPQFDRCRPAGDTFAATSAHDLAVLRLRTPILASEDFAAVPADVAPPAGTVASVIGFGDPAGDRRMGQMQLESVEPDGSLIITGLGAGTCAGDSGAALVLPGAGCGGLPLPIVAGVISSQPVGVARVECRPDTTHVAASLTDPANAQFLADVRSGAIAPFDPESPAPGCTASE